MRPLGMGLLALTLALTACSSDSEPNEEPQPAAEWSVSGALADVPDAAASGRVWLQTADLATGVELAGLQRGGPSLDWLNPLTGIVDPGAQPAPVFVPLPAALNPIQGQEQMEKVLGFNLDAVDTYVTQEAPPLEFSVLRGADLGADALSDALLEEGGVLTDVQGEDLQVGLDRADALSALGRPTRISAVEHAVAMSSSTPLVQQWREDGKALADRAGLAAVAEALDDGGAYAAVITDAVPGVLSGVQPGATPAQAKQLLEELEQQVPAAPFDVIGIGWALDGGEARVHVAYHFGEADSAATGAEVLEKAWVEGTSLRTQRPLADLVKVLDTEARGNVVVVTLTPTEGQSPQLVLNMLTSQESVFFSR